MDASEQSSTAALEIRGVTRRYQALRPLRVEELTVATGERVAVKGMDAGSAEVLVNLITGAALPDEGIVRVFGRSTGDISEGDDWLASLDRFGIVSPRAILLEEATIEQNLAIPFTLEIDPVPPGIHERVVRLAAECGIREGGVLDRRVADVGPELRARINLARAIAMDPALLLLEHPTADVPQPARSAYAEDVARMLEGRRQTALVITQDGAFAMRVAQRVMELQPSTGVLEPLRKGWFW